MEHSGLPVRINLLPFREIRKQENVRNQILISLVFVALAIGGLFWYHTHLNGRIDFLKGEIKKVNKKIDAQEKIIKKVEALEAKRDEVQKKLDAVTKLKNDRDEAFLLMDTLTGTVVEGRMWLIRFDIEEKVTSEMVTVTYKEDGKDKKKKEEKITVTMPMEIEGIALDNRTVAVFMTNLENAKRPEGEDFFKEIKLGKLEQIAFSQGKEKAPIDLKKFTVECLKVSPKKAEDDKAKKKKGK